LIICSIYDNNTAQEKIEMVTTKKIEKKVAGLASEELAKLYAWFEEYDAQ